MTNINKTWHLARNNEEVKVTEFELQLWRVFDGFLRWQEECEQSVNGTNLTGHELAVLHIIRMKNKPKKIYDIARLLNRNDTFNIQYSIKKLLKLGLVEKTKTSGDKKNTSYQVTKKGVKNTDAYTQIRGKILIEMFSQEKGLDLELLTKNLIKLKSLYDEAISSLK